MPSTPLAGREFSLGRGDHWVELLEVDALGRELGGDRDLLLGRDRLGVVGGNEGRSTGWTPSHPKTRSITQPASKSCSGISLRSERRSAGPRATPSDEREERGERGGARPLPQRLH